MIKNYFKIAWRSLLRQKGHAFINIAGLGVGLAACLLLFVVIRYELGFNRSVPHADRIYRLVTEDKYNDGITYNPGIPAPLVDVFRTKFPEVTSSVFDNSGGSQITVITPADHSAAAQKKFIEDYGLMFVEPQAFDILPYSFLAGSPAVLKDPNTVVLNRSTAEKYFGDWHQAVGRQIKLDNAVDLTVAGVMDDIPANTDIPMRILISYETLKSRNESYSYSKEWGRLSSNFEMLVMLPSQMDKEAFNARLLDFSQKQYSEKTGSSRRVHFLQPLTEMHFDSRFEVLGDHRTSKATISTLILVGLLIIIMACINFVNLSTAQAVGRSREVGVRKVLGGSRLQLFFQMMGETTIIVLLSVATAVLLAKLFFPYLKNISSLPQQIPVITLPNLIFLVSITVGVIILSGLYPALVLSGFKPAQALKNKINSASVGGISLRRALVVLQFSISQILVIGTIIALTQMNFVHHADLGFNKDAVYVLTGNADSASIARLPAFKQYLQSVPGIQSISFCSDVPSSDNNSSGNFAFDNKPDLDFPVFMKFGDEDYVKTFGLQLIAGRNFYRSDTVSELLINQTLMKKLGVQDPNAIVGKKIRLGGGRWINIAGVVKDFQTNSLRETVKPLLLASSSRFYQQTAIKIHSGNLGNTRQAIEAAWNRFFPEYAFTGNFLDQNIADFYKQEEQLSTLYKIFAGLAIFISCLGLYGLVSFMAVQRVKEVGIRKVLGASVAHIVYLFSREFTILIGIAFLIAVPVAYYLMNTWLGNFAYRISIGISVFILAVSISIAIAWLTVGYKAFKAALANPVKSLRSE